MMFWRWLTGSYGTTVIAGFVSMPWLWPQAPGAGIWVALGFFVALFSVPFVLAGSLLGWGFQRALERRMGPGWERTAMLACLVIAAGGGGTHLITHTQAYVVIAGVAALSGAVLSQYESAWRKAAWSVVLSGALASALAIGTVR